MMPQGLAHLKARDACSPTLASWLWSPGRIDCEHPRLQVLSSGKAALSSGTEFQRVTMTAGRH